MAAVKTSSRNLFEVSATKAVPRNKIGLIFALFPAISSAPIRLELGTTIVVCCP